MNGNTVVRQLHRWLSIAFTMGVITYMVVMLRGRPPAWLGLFALLPLVALLISGLYLFALPYVVRFGRGRGRGRIDKAAISHADELEAAS